jgi:Skp family chaperone for outer membrane proteins
VKVLEQKYQDAIQLLDKAELKKDRAVFESDMAKKEKQKYVDLYNQSQAELQEARARIGELDQQCHEL